MLSVHRRCHLVVTCKLQKICSWISMNSHRNASGTRPAAVLNNLTLPIPMSLRKELETSVFRCQELLSNLSHGNVAPETPQLSIPSTPPFQCFPGGEAAPVTPRVENSKTAPSFSVPVSHPMIPSTLPPDSVVAPSHADPVVAHDHAPTQFDGESAVDTQFDDPFQFDDPPVPTPVIPSQPKPVYDHRDDLPHHIRTQLQSRIRKPAQNREPDAKRFAFGCWQTSSFDVVSRCFIRSRLLPTCDSLQIL